MMSRFRQFLRRVLRRDRWDNIPTVTELWRIARERARRADKSNDKPTERKTRASTFFTLP